MNNHQSPKLLERLDNAENLLFSMMDDVEKILRLFSRNLSNAGPQLEPVEIEPEEKEIEEASIRAFKKINELNQKLKEITKDLPLDIPKQIKNDNIKRFQDQNLALVLENYINEISNIIDKEKIEFPNTFPYANNLLD